MKIDEYLTELHKKAYKNNQEGGCTTRAQLLYLVLKKSGYDPKILRYFVNGEKDKDENDRKKLNLLDGSIVSSHVVVELSGNILDANIGKIITKQDYEKKLLKKSGYDAESVLYPKLDIELCRLYVERYKLENFYFLFD